MAHPEYARDDILTIRISPKFEGDCCMMTLSKLFHQVSEHMLHAKQVLHTAKKIWWGACKLRYLASYTNTMHGTCLLLRLGVNHHRVNISGSSWRGWKHYGN
jgi:hypothetical protein